MRLVKNLFKNKEFLAVSLIVAFSLIATLKTSGFYVWHDDWGVFYTVQTGECLLGWPYYSTCIIFSFLENIFNYHIAYYFWFAIGLFIFTSLALYFFLRNFFKIKTSFLATLVFATGHVGENSFQEAHIAITSFLSVGFLFLALFLLIKFLSNLRIKWFFLFLFCFAISVAAAQARSTMYFVPPVLLVLFFGEKLDIKEKATYASVTLFFFVLFYFPLLPYLSKGERVFNSTSLISRFLLETDVTRNFVVFFRTLSSLTLTDPVKVGISGITNTNIEVVSLISGVLVASGLIYLTFKSRKNKKIFRLRLLGLAWVTGVYLPFGLRFNMEIWTTHKYLFFVFPGVLLFWTTLSKRRAWTLLTLIFIVYGFVQSNLLFDEHLKSSQKRKSFYSQLRASVDTVSENSTFYFSFPDTIEKEANDFFRAGFTPSVSALGTEFAQDYNRMRLITQNEVFYREFREGGLDTSELLTFYYDGENLHNTTDMVKRILDSRRPLRFGTNVDSKQDFVYLESTDKRNWTGRSENLEFTISDYIPVFLSTMTVELKAEPDGDFPIPYTQKCIGCDKYVNEDLEDTLDYLTESKNLKNKVGLTASDSEQNTYVESVLDEKETYWQAHKARWYSTDEKPSITFSFERPEGFEGIVFYSSGPRVPVDFNITADEKQIDWSVVAEGDWAKVVFEEVTAAREWVFEIESTAGGDVPTIFDVDFISGGFSDINPEYALLLRGAPAGMISSPEEKDALINYLQSTEVKSCIEWIDGTNTGKAHFDIRIDGVLRKYEIDIPIIGVSSPRFQIGCIDYPAKLDIGRVEVEFLQK